MAIITNLSTIRKNFSTKDTDYRILQDYDLGGQTLTIPEGCTLSFIGGSFQNGTIEGNNTLLTGAVKIDKIAGTFMNFGPSSKRPDPSTDPRATDMPGGFQYFDTDLNLPVYWNAAGGLSTDSGKGEWVDASALAMKYIYDLHADVQFSSIPEYIMKQPISSQVTLKWGAYIASNSINIIQQKLKSDKDGYLAINASDRSKSVNISDTTKYTLEYTLPYKVSGTKELTISAYMPYGRFLDESLLNNTSITMATNIQKITDSILKPSTLAGWSEPYIYGPSTKPESIETKGKYLYIAISGDTKIWTTVNNQKLDFINIGSVNITLGTNWSGVYNIYRSPFAINGTYNLA